VRESKGTWALCEALVLVSDITPSGFGNGK